MGSVLEKRGISMFSKAKTFIEIIRLCDDLRKNGGIRICSATQAQDFAGFVGYRAQLALYELHTEIGPTMTWDDFISLVQRNADIRDEIRRIVGYAIFHFDVAQLNFELPVDAFIYQEDNQSNSVVNFCKIFPAKMGFGVIELLFIQFEAEHFKRLAAATPKYTWKTYVDDLSNNPELWSKFSRGFQNGLRQLDFKASWMVNATLDEISRLEFQKKKRNIKEERSNE